MIVVDLDSPAGAALVAVAPRNPAASMRFAYPGKLATSVRGRLKRLADRRESRRAAARPRHAASSKLTALLGSPRCAVVPGAKARERRPAHITIELCGGGLGAAYFRVGGRTFDRKDPLGRLSFQGAQHLQTLGALTDYDRGREDAERNWVWERWVGAYEWREASISRDDPALSTVGRSTSSSPCATKSACAWLT